MRFRPLMLTLLLAFGAVMGRGGVKVDAQEIIAVRPQAGPQEVFLSTPADIAIYGGAAGGGKSWALLLDPLRHVMDNPGFSAVIFRRNSTQVLNPGGLWDESIKLYPYADGVPLVTRMTWKWANGGKIKFAHLEDEKSKLDWQGSQTPLICCEENTPVKITGGKTRKLSELKVGDLVETLQGLKPIKAIGDRRLEDCVLCVTEDGKTQIHSKTHKFLTLNGWASYAEMLETGQYAVLQLSDVVVQNQKDLLSGGTDKVRRDTLRNLRYVHPYTAQEQIAEVPVEVQSLKITPVGLKWVIDLTIDDTNHYITESGLVNKNCFDELTHFTRGQFFYMLSRNRSLCGVKPYIRATCNPDADSWVAELISWWIDPETGCAIQERSGVVRWFIVLSGKIVWADSRQDLINKYGNAGDSEHDRIEPKSLTFIAANIYDNRVLLESDPGYLSNLKALPLVEQSRLLGGNWKIRPAAGLMFKREWCQVVDAVPSDMVIVRYWDLAATEKTDTNDPDWTSGIKMGRSRSTGLFYILDNKRFRANPHDTETAWTNTASQDGQGVKIRFPQDPGQAGKVQAAYIAKKLAGFNVGFRPERGSKVTRFGPFSSQSAAGNIKVLRGAWNDALFTSLEAFPDAVHDDDADACSGAFEALTTGFDLNTFARAVNS